MKTPRFFIALTVCTVVSTIALSSFDCALRVASAQTLPVLRVNPWAGDPEDPKGPMEMPYEDWSSYSTSDELELTPAVRQPVDTRHSTLTDWHSVWIYSLTRMLLGWRL